jgi:hypothetical protein
MNILLDHIGQATMSTISTVTKPTENGVPPARPQYKAEPSHCQAAQDRQDKRQSSGVCRGMYFLKQAYSVAQKHEFGVVYQKAASKKHL